MAASSLSSFLSSLLLPKRPSPPLVDILCLLSQPHLRQTPSKRASLLATWGPSAPPSSFSSLHNATDISPILFPSLAYSSTLFFKSAYNVQIIVNDNEPEEKLLNRFRKEVLKAGVLLEAKRRRFFENKHEKKKRKAREAARKNRKRRPLPKAPKDIKHLANKERRGDEKDDNWDVPDVDLPYC
ncbi:30S ribosomal protein S21 [Quillaja saponaria]|uniref:30S ribosomal protein S21 n=1 Tax=Quillaja saponaria TaxID=32244 RepID=A0AAD7PIF9_QUISA|nr:30S ribosomal protein S21 [Quillaja saponaria]